tara:strand:+ start:167 stop:1081 length:915 start_codon:yes stop_codon:yes gene_type:complete
LKDNWDFSSSLPESFNQYSETDIKLQYGIRNVKTFFKRNHFKGSGTRNLYPKKINSNINEYSKGLVYRLPKGSLLSIYFEKGKLDPEFFKCYQKLNLIVGNCEESEFEIRSTSDKYQVLDNNLLMINGGTKTRGVELTIFDLNSSSQDSLSFSYQRIESKFNWLTPLEDITSPVILGASVGGISVGELIESLFVDLPQKTSWITKVYSISIKKRYDLDPIYAVIEPKITYGNRLNYQKYESNEKFNFNIQAYLGKKFQNLEIKFMGNFYTNFLLWEREELYNPRTSKFFKKSFGTLGLELVYVF